MGKVKNLEKKDKSAAEFDKKNPANRVKSINDDKLKKKSKQKNKTPSAIGGAIEKEAKPLVKEAKKEIAKALKAKKSLAQAKTEDKPKTGETSTSTVELPEKLATRDVIKKAVKAIKDGIEKEKEASTTKNLFDDEMRFGLQVVAAKVPKTPAHTKKILLDHSLFGEEQPDICFIVRDKKGSKKSDLVVDETVLEFEEVLKEAGIANIKLILPLTKLKKDYGPNNMKLKLLNSYDLFLVESEIAEHAYTILGKHFIKKRKRPLQIDTSKKETMKISIDNAQRKVAFKVSSNSNFSIFEIGTHKMDNGKITDNISSAIDQLKEKWPGGWVNIMRLYLKPMRPSKVSIPLYYSKVSPNDVEVPVEVGVKQTRLDKLNELLAKKSKRLRIDRKTKRIVKINVDAGQKVDGQKKKKDKKRKADDTSAAKVETVEKKKPKKEVKVEEPMPDATETKPKKKKKSSESEVIPEVPAEDKKKKKSNSEPEPTALPAAIKAEKKSKKSAEVAPPAADEPKKKKNKKNK